MPQIHTVKEGESLWSISEKYLGKGSLWETIGGYTGDPKLLPIGTPLTIPTPEEKETTVISTEDSKEDIDTDKDLLAGYEEGKEKEVFPESPTPWQVVKIEDISYIYNPNKTQWDLLPVDKKDKDEFDQDEKDALGLEEPEEYPQLTALKTDVENLNADIDDVMSQLDGIRTSSSDATDNLIKSIQNKFDYRRSQMADINKRAKAQLITYGIRMGTARYSPLIATGIISAEERAGISRISALDAEESTLIAEARQAQTAMDWEMLSDKLDEIQETRDKKVNEMNSLIEKQEEAEKEWEEKLKTAIAETSIVDLMSNGITNPLELFNLINYDKDGNYLGVIGMKDITDLLGDMPEDKIEKEEHDIIDGVPYRVVRDDEGNITSFEKISGVKAKTTSSLKSVFKETEKGLEQFILDENQNIISRNTIGISGINARKVREAIATFKTADSILTQIEDLADAVIVAETTKDIPSQYIEKNIEALTKSNPQAVVFLSSIDAFTSMLARAAGEKGVLTSEDLLRIMSALPSLTDTKASKDLKIRTLRNLYEAIKTGSIEAYTTPFKELTEEVVGLPSDESLDKEFDKLSE